MGKTTNVLACRLAVLASRAARLHSVRLMLMLIREPFYGNNPSGVSLLGYVANAIWLGKKKIGFSSQYQHSCPALNDFDHLRNVTLVVFG